VLAWLRSSAGDALAGRKLWCASLSGSHEAGRHLRGLLKDDLDTGALAVGAAEPAFGGSVRPGDVVVLHDCFTASFAAALRDHEAHVVWHLRERSGSSAPGTRAASELIARSGGAAVDAVVVDERAGAGGQKRVAALIPASRLLDIRELPGGDDAGRAERLALAWISLLGDIVEEDRADHVGGTIQARPVFAPR
jgi:hypothetical protein